MFDPTTSPLTKVKACSAGKCANWAAVHFLLSGNVIKK